VHVAAHGLRHLVGAQPVGIERIAAQAGLDLEAPKQPVEQAEAVGIAVQHSALAEWQERGGGVDRRHRTGVAEGASQRGDGRIGVEEIQLDVVGAMPADVLGRELRRPQLAASAPEAGEISRIGERHRAQRDPRRPSRRRRHQRGSAAIRHHGGELSVAASEWRFVVPLEAQEASYLAASARIATCGRVASRGVRRARRRTGKAV